MGQYCHCFMLVMHAMCNTLTVKKIIFVGHIIVAFGSSVDAKKGMEEKNLGKTKEYGNDKGGVNRYGYSLLVEIARGCRTLFWQVSL